MREDTLAIVRGYHASWSSGRFTDAFAALSEELKIEVPINDYPTKASFTEAVARFAGAVSTVKLLTEFANDRDAMLLYDMDVRGLGSLRVAEHFIVEKGKITRIRQIHDTAALRDIVAEPSLGEALGRAHEPTTAVDLTRRIRLRASADRVFTALATADGMRGWWTDRVSGTGGLGAVLRLEFAGLDEHIDLRLDELRSRAGVVWTCLEHTELTEWNGTRITFSLADAGHDSCDLDFRHVGLTPGRACYEDCTIGWDHFLASLAAYVERGHGMPFGEMAGKKIRT
jgi:uncharacterized protein YndB with AHSA1/START domain